MRKKILYTSFPESSTLCSVSLGEKGGGTEGDKNFSFPPDQAALFLFSRLQRKTNNLNKYPYKYGAIPFPIHSCAQRLGTCRALKTKQTSSSKVLDTFLTKLFIETAEDFTRCTFSNALFLSSSSLKGSFTIFLFSVRSHILNNNGMWYS